MHGELIDVVGVRLELSVDFLEILLVLGQITMGWEGVKRVGMVNFFYEQHEYHLFSWYKVIWQVFKEIPICKVFEEIPALKMFDKMFVINTIIGLVDDFTQGYNDDRGNNDHVETFQILM
jgi:hypothetical protein